MKACWEQLYDLGCDYSFYRHLATHDESQLGMVYLIIGFSFVVSWASLEIRSTIVMVLARNRLRLAEALWWY